MNTIITDKRATKAAEQTIEAYFDAERALTLTKAEIETLTASTERLQARLDHVHEETPTTTGYGDADAADALLADPDMKTGSAIMAKLKQAVTRDKSAVKAHREEAAPLRGGIARGKQRIAALEAKVPELEADLHDATLFAAHACSEAYYSELVSRSEAMRTEILDPMFNLWRINDGAYRHPMRHGRKMPEGCSVHDPRQLAKLSRADGRNTKAIFPAWDIDAVEPSALFAMFRKA